MDQLAQITIVRMVGTASCGGLRWDHFCGTPNDNSSTNTATGKGNSHIDVTFGRFPPGKKSHTTSANPQIIVSCFELTVFASICFAKNLFSAWADLDERTFSNLFFIKQLCCWTLRLPLSFKKALKQKIQANELFMKRKYFSLSFFHLGVVLCFDRGQIKS